MALNFSCPPLAPKSNKFASDVYDAWGYGGVAYLAVPPALTVAILAIFCEEVYYIMTKTNSKDLRNSLVWILSTYPAIMVLGTIAVFMPRSVVYLTFLYNMYVAFSTYKYYYLIIVFCGGTSSYVDKSRHKEVGLNVIPCCCLCCLPSIHNSPRVTVIAKWMIFQNVILTPFYGALATLLKSDFSLYSTTKMFELVQLMPNTLFTTFPDSKTTVSNYLSYLGPGLLHYGVSPSVYISAFNSIATLMCMYGFNLIQRFAKTIEGMEEKHAIKGKTTCFQLIMITTGLQTVLFNILGSLDVFPCEKPFAFNSSRKAFNNYAVVLQTFFIALGARYYYRRRVDILRQHTLTDDLSIGSGEYPKTIEEASRTYTPGLTYNGTGEQVGETNIAADQLQSQTVTYKTRVPQQGYSNDSSQSDASCTSA